jgi:hypothetical protein
MTADLKLRNLPLTERVTIGICLFNNGEGLVLLASMALVTRHSILIDAIVGIQI